MPFHFCQDEVLAILAMVPFIGIFFAKLHAWYHTKFHHKCHEKDCSDTHVVHTQIIHDDGPEPEAWFEPGWDWISQDDVESRFGGSIMDDLIGDHRLLKVDVRPEDDEFVWFVNDNQELRAVFKNRSFIHGHDQCEHGWDEVTP